MTVESKRCEMATVKSVREIGPKIFELRLHAPHIAAEAKPGQFVHLRIGHGLDPLLRRPLSIGLAEEKTIHLLFRVVGQGTELLSRVVEGEHLDALGPLGNPFILHCDRPAILVAGGLGIADMPLLVHGLSTGGCPEIHLLYGAQTATELAWAGLIKGLGATVHTATNDGTAGHHGLCTEPLGAVMESLSGPPAIYACGPEPMFRAILATVTDPEIPIQLAFEQRMGCGFGACMACAVETNRGYVRACVEGPVLDGSLFR